jgi:hypothetical protein
MIPKSNAALTEEPLLSVRRSRMENEQLALPMTFEERRADRKRLDQLHPGNRFRLMFGQPLLPQGPVGEWGRSLG